MNVAVFYHKKALYRTYSVYGYAPAGYARTQAHTDTRYTRESVCTPTHAHTSVARVKIQESRVESDSLIYFFCFFFCENRGFLNLFGGCFV